MAAPWCQSKSAIDWFFHSGVKYRSGRYPYGSGEYPYQHEPWFAGFGGYSEGDLWTKDENGKTLPEKEIANALGISTTELRATRTAWRTSRQTASVEKAKELMEHDNISRNQAAAKLGIPERTLASWLDEDAQVKNQRKNGTTELLKEQVEDNQYIDVGKGIPTVLGIGQATLNSSLKQLTDEGYQVFDIDVAQATNTRQQTHNKILAGPGVTKEEVMANLDEVVPPYGSYTTDGGLTWCNIMEPLTVDSSRVMVNYPSTGGAQKDGVIELRRDVDDLSLGDSNYAQVRISVDGTHYLKGMAVYADDLPEGVDIRFNTSKPDGTPMMAAKGATVLKRVKDDTDNPFGATVRQLTEVVTDDDGNPVLDSNGKQVTKVVSACNIVNSDEDWANWSRTLSSQFLSKQNPYLAKQQLDLTYQQKVDEFEEIMSVNNPTIKSYLLTEFSEGCDSAAVDLKAAALPGQAAHVLLPLTSISDTEVYAPDYENGERVALVRYPHASVSEMPVLTVNNTNVEGKEVLGNTSTAIGINSKVAEQLSGADFDGDTVTVIPLNSTGVPLKYSQRLSGLTDFDPHTQYAKSEDDVPTGPTTDNFHTNMQMGVISNLITDMTIKGAGEDEITRAIKHSMVIIDAEKHNLDWKQSYIDNGIQELKDKWQDGGGASTLISRAKGEERVDERRTFYKTDPETGEKIWENTNRTYRSPVVTYETGETKKNGDPKTKTETVTWTKYKTLQEEGKDPEIVGYKTQKAQETITKMEKTNNAYTLASDPDNPTVIERVYADYANSMKSLANQARLAAYNTEEVKKSSAAAEMYADEVESLTRKYTEAISNAPLERMAQRAASVVIKSKLADNNYSKDQEKRMRNQVINAARNKFGTKTRVDRYIRVTDKEWEALLAGAFSKSRTSDILAQMDTNDIKQRATPRSRSSLTSGQISRARSLLNSGNRTWSEVAASLGVSVTTLRNAINS